MNSRWTKYKDMVEFMVGSENFDLFKEGYKSASYPKENLAPGQHLVNVANIRVYSLKHLQDKSTTEVLRSPDILEDWFAEWYEINGDNLYKLDGRFWNGEQYTHDFYARLAYMMGYMLGYARPRKIRFLIVQPSRPRPISPVYNSEDDLLPEL